MWTKVKLIYEKVKFRNFQAYNQAAIKVIIQQWPAGRFEYDKTVLYLASR